MSDAPRSRNSGRGSTKKHRAVRTATAAEFTPSHSLRRPPASERCPVTGASSAMAKPPTASAAPRTAEALSSPPKALDVRYTVNTKVVMTALKAAEPQSQEAQASTRPLLDDRDPVSSSEAGCIAPGAL